MRVIFKDAQCSQFEVIDNHSSQKCNFWQGGIGQQELEWEEEHRSAGSSVSVHITVAV